MMRFLPSTTEAELRQAILECGRACYERRLLSSSDGNISVRLGDGGLLITASGIAKGRMQPDDILQMDLEGDLLSPTPGRRASSESAMHLEVYRQRPDVRAVIHAHPPFATALTVAGLEFPGDVLPEVMLALGEVPVTPYATSSSYHNADAIRPFIKAHDALLLSQHGSLTVGRDLEQALNNLERLESVAEVFWLARMLGDVKRIPPAALEELIAIRGRLFGT
ncbi:MAG: class II aldolase/adducin family protein [Bacteroidota bacterium]